MGLDGGTLASRSDLLRRASWRLTTSNAGTRSTRGGQLGVADALNTSGVERRDQLQDAIDFFSTCALSGTALPRVPGPRVVVACALGRLYLRDAVVAFLTKTDQFQPGMCDTVALEEAHGHICRLRDVFDVMLEPAPEWNVPSSSRPDGGGGSERRPVGPWRCPVDRARTTNGQHCFVALRPCGHVMREQVTRELSTAAQGGASRAPPVLPRTGAADITGAPPSSSSAPTGDQHAVPKPDLHGRGDGITTLHGGSWACPVCDAPVEVTVCLNPPAQLAEKVKAAFRSERHANNEQRRKSGKKRKASPGAPGIGSAEGEGSSGTGTSPAVRN